MAEEHRQEPSSRGKSRRERVEHARSRDILDVANELNMELVQSGRDYRWKEHDSMVISPKKNMWNWFSRHQGGDVIALVQTMKEIDFNQAIDFLNDGSFKKFTKVEQMQEPFSYYLAPYEKPFEAARSYLKDKRGLSDETIDFFLNQGVLAQANAKINDSIEPVVVFKSFDFSGEIVGATLQGIEENWVKWPKRGYAKNIVRNSDGITGLHVDLGQPNRLIFAESAIDLMSYYELNKDRLQDVRLISMDGLKEGMIGRHLAQLQSELSGRPIRWSQEQLAEGLQFAIDNGFFADGKHADWITLAVDNDEGGRNFIDSLREKGANINEDLPDLQPGQDKTDWNDVLKQYSDFGLSDDNREHDQVINEEQGVLFENLADVTSTTNQTDETEFNANHDYTQVSYDTFKANQKGLSEAVQSQIRAGNLRVTLSDEAYFYTLVNYTGWSHPMQQLKPKALESLKEYRTFFESINDTNIDRFKEKGTPEQNQMYDILKSLEKDLERSNTSTVFSEEVAISAYNLNRRLDSLTAENWGKAITNPLGSLGRDTWNILSYPANDIVTRNVDYYDQLVQYHLLDYLNGKNGTVEISPETYEIILQHLKDEAVVITPEVVEEVTTSPEQVVSSDEETEKNLDNHQEQAILEQQQKDVQLKDISTLHSEWEQELKDKVTQHLGHTPQWWELDRNRGPFITSELDQLFAKRSSLELDAHFADDSEYVRQEIKELDEQILTTIQQEKTPERTQEQAILEQQQKDIQLKDISTLYSEWEQKLKDKVTQHLGHTPQWWELERNRGPFITSELDQLFAKRSSLELDAHFADNSEYVRQEIKELDEQILTTIQQEKTPERTQEQAKRKLLAGVTRNPQSPQLKNSEINNITTAAHSIYEDYLVFLTTENEVLLGKSENYNSKGVYDNKDDSLIKVSDNKKMFQLLHDGNMTLSKEEMIDQGYRAVEDYKELETLKTGILSYLLERAPKKVDTALQQSDNSQANKKAPEMDQEQQKNAENIFGDFPGTQEAAPLPDANKSQPLNDLSPNQTQSQLYLNFSTIAPDKSTIYKPNYHPVSDKELRKLNRYASVVQTTAQWYLENLADSKLHYFYRDDEGLKNVTISFQKEHFMHLTGIAPVGPGQSAEKSLLDFAQGHGEFENILISNRGGTFSKLQVLPEIEEIIQSDSFYFNDLTEIDKFQSLHLDKAILSPDKDMMVAIRTVDNTSFPASLLKVNQKLSTELESIPEKAVMGIYRERLGELKQLSINEVYIKDGGQEMFSILKNKQYEKSLPTEIGQPISQLQLKSLRNYFAREMDKVETGVGRSGAGVAYRAYYLRNSYDNRMEIADTDLDNELSSEEQLDSLMNKIAENYGKPFWDVVQHPDFQLSDAESNQLAYPIVTQESLSEVFGYVPESSKERISSEIFTQVLDAAYNVGNPKELGLAIPEESQPAWEQYFQLSEKHQGKFSEIVAEAEQLNLLDKTSSFYYEWREDRIYSEEYHVRLNWSDRGPDGLLPFKDGELIEYKDFVTTLYRSNQEFYDKKQAALIGEEITPYTKVEFDIYAPGGRLIKNNIRYDIGDETEPVSRLLGLGYRRLDGQAELAQLDDLVLSQLENQEVNQDIATEANEQNLKRQDVLQDEASSFRENFRSPNQEMRAGLAQRIEEIMVEDAAKILASSVPQIQENLSVEGNLVGTPQTGGRMLYINREDFGQDYQLELVVHSPSEIDNLSDTQVPWTLSVIKGEKELGYLAYGSDWGKDFQIEEELERLATQISSGKVPEGLYKQEEVDAFLANNSGNEKLQESIPTAEAEPFDYTNASAYEINEHALQKIREYTQSPENLKEYMDFMSKFPQLSPRNVALIHEQWPGANAVATYDQWQALGEALGIGSDDVIETKRVYTNLATGEKNDVVLKRLSVKANEKAKITLFRPLMTKMIPVLDTQGNHLKNDKGNPKYKKLKDATSQEKALVAEGKLKVKQFQVRDFKTGQPVFTTYKVFELSQTTLKPESYPKAMPNRHYNFNMDKVKTKEVLEGLCDYAESIGVKMMKDEAHVLGNAKGAFYPGEQLILINPDNTPGEKIATTIHELAHATLHNPRLADQYKELPKGQMELEAEMTSYLLSKHFGLDTSEKAIDYMAGWTENLKIFDDKQLANSLNRVHKTISKIMKQIEVRTKPYQVGKNKGQQPNFPKAPTKGPSR